MTLAAEDVTGGNRDFILQYGLQGGAIESGLLLYPGAREKFFLLMLEPPAPGTAPAAPPREYVFIVDVSGSMNGFPLTVSKNLISNIILGLRPDDVFNILFFAGASTTLFPQSLPATADNVDAAMTLLDEQAGGGGTNLLSALQHALSLEKAAGLSRTVVIATDGYVSVEKQAFDLIEQGAGDANVFTFGIGSSVNRSLIEGLARAGRGEPFVVTDIADGEPAAARFARYVEHPLLIDIDVAMDGLGAYDVEPPSLPDLFAERPLVLFGKYAAPVGSIRVSGMTTDGAFEATAALSPAQENPGNSPLEYLWARERIARLSDYGRVGVDVKEEVIALGLEYNLVTEYTSFVAVDTVVRANGEVVTVKQPLPLPQGVEDSALGGMTSDVEAQGKLLTPWAVVKRTALLPNFPNPFNPETWIPFQLVEDAHVVVRIYDIDGRLVRELDVGKRAAGMYATREDAAYWDGKNELGEAVAAGVYLCELTAGERRAVRRMTIAK